MDALSYLEQLLLVAIYDLIEGDSERIVDVKTLLFQFEFEQEGDKWIDIELDQLSERGLVSSSSWKGARDKRPVKLTDDGMRRAYSLKLSGIKSYSRVRYFNSIEPDEHAAPLIIDKPAELPEFIQSEGIESLKSESWTGIPSEAVLDARRISALQLAFIDADRRIDALKLSNWDAAQAKALVAATLALANAPEPPAKQISDLINLMAQIAGIAGLFVSIFALFR